MPAGDSRLVVPQICGRTLGGHQFETQQVFNPALPGSKGLAHQPLEARVQVLKSFIAGWIVLRL